MHPVKVDGEPPVPTPEAVDYEMRHKAVGAPAIESRKGERYFHLVDVVERKFRIGVRPQNARTKAARSDIERGFDICIYKHVTIVKHIERHRIARGELRESVREILRGHNSRVRSVPVRLYRIVGF